MKTHLKNIWHQISSRFLAGGFVIVSTLLVACDEQLAFGEYKSFPKEGWHMRDTLHFVIDSLQETGPYTLNLGIRTSTANPYPFKDLQVEFSQRWVSSSHKDTTDSLQPVALIKTSLDTIDCHLVSDKGDNLGTGISNFQYIVPIDTLQLPVGAKGNIYIVHRMRMTTLPGIANVGVELRRVE
ncbi:MAG: gliding motility lipoprotein GldH [Bacteroidaceae bacterium]|nr:gliding motility lipoprotein GldH [Bacteroidaceae bacterium]